MNWKSQDNFTWLFCVWSCTKALGLIEAFSFTVYIKYVDKCIIVYEVQLVWKTHGMTNLCFYFTTLS